MRARAAFEMDEETVTLAVAAVAGIGAGIGIPVFFTLTEKRDKERIEEIRELNRATLKATGETLSEARPSGSCRVPRDAMLLGGGSHHSGLADPERAPPAPTGRDRHDASVPLP